MVKNRVHRDVEPEAAKVQIREPSSAKYLCRAMELTSMIAMNDPSILLIGFMI
jgi:hypothetical protein